MNTIAISPSLIKKVHGFVGGHSLERCEDAAAPSTGGHAECGRLACPAADSAART